MNCNQTDISAHLIKIARTAHSLLEDTAIDSTGDETVIKYPNSILEELEEMLNELDTLPDPLGEVATGPRKAEYWIEMSGPRTSGPGTAPTP